MTLLEFRDLHVTYSGSRGRIPAVRGVDLTVDAGETIGIAGRVRVREVDAGDGGTAAAAEERRGDRADPARRRRPARDGLGPAADRALDRRVDRVPGGDALAQRGAPHRTADRRADPAAREDDSGGRGETRRGAAGAGRTAAVAGAQLPARTVGRAAPARDDRDGARVRPGPDHRRRGDDRTRRDGAGPSAAVDLGPGHRTRGGADDDQPRPVGALGGVRPGRGHVRGADRRAGPGPRGVRERAAPVLGGARRGVPGDRGPGRAEEPRGPGRAIRRIRSGCPTAARSGRGAPWPWSGAGRSGRSSSRSTRRARVPVSWLRKGNPLSSVEAARSEKC